MGVGARACPPDAPHRPRIVMATRGLWPAGVAAADRPPGPQPHPKRPPPIVRRTIRRCRRVRRRGHDAPATRPAPARLRPPTGSVGWASWPSSSCRCQPGRPARRDDRRGCSAAIASGASSAVAARCRREKAGGRSGENRASSPARRCRPGGQPRDCPAPAPAPDNRPFPGRFRRRPR